MLSSFYACRQKHFDIVQYLISRDDFEFKNESNCYGTSLLMGACQNGELEIVKILLEFENIDVNISVDRYGVWNALTCAVDACKERKQFGLNILQILLERPDLDLNATSPEKKNTIFHESSACFQEQSYDCEIQQSIIKLLMSMSHLDVNAKNYFGETALSLLILNNCKACLNHVLKRKDIDVKVQGENNILNWAMNHEYFDIIKILLSEKLYLDVNMQADKKTGNTLLMWAYEKQQIEIVVMIMAKYKNVNLNLQNKNNQTIFDIMRKRKRTHDIIENYAIEEPRRKKQRIN